MKSGVALLSFDIEEFDLPTEYGKPISIEDQLAVSVAGLRAVLKLLAEHGLRATFYSTVVFAENNAELIGSMVADGHEIASHGCCHGRQLPEHLALSKSRLEEIASTTINGYRAPRMGTVDIETLNFKGQIEANMTDAGLIGLLGGMLTSEVNFRTLSFYFNLIPYIAPIAATLFAVPLLCGMLLKIPFRGGVTADLLSRGAPQENFYPRAAMWAVSAVGIFGFLLVCVFEWFKCFGFL